MMFALGIASVVYILGASWVAFLLALSGVKMSWRAPLAVLFWPVVIPCIWIFR